MDGYLITMNKELVNPDLLLVDEPSLPEAMRQLGLCDAFVGMMGNRNVSVCLLTKRKTCFEIVNLSVDPLQAHTDAAAELLMYVLDYVRVQGGRYVEAGASNTNLRRHILLQSVGFRVVGVWPDHFAPLEVTFESGEKILTRDLLRYQADLSWHK